LESLKPCVARGTGIQPTLVDALSALIDDGQMRTALDAAEETLDERERDFIRNIREHGWFRTSVFGDGQNPSFSYTTGFWLTLGFPEIVVFALKPETAHAVLWDIWNDIRQDRTPAIGEPADLFGNHKGYLLPVRQAEYSNHLGWNRWFYGGDDFPCVQMVWPDREGQFPWDSEFDAGFQDDQPDLSVSGWDRFRADLK